MQCLTEEQAEEPCLQGTWRRGGRVLNSLYIDPPQRATCVGAGGYLCRLQFTFWKPGQMHGPSGPCVQVQRPNRPCVAGNFDTGIGRLPPKAYAVHISPIPEYIVGMDVLKGLTIATTQGKFHLDACGKAHHHKGAPTSHDHKTA